MNPNHTNAVVVSHGLRKKVFARGGYYAANQGAHLSGLTSGEYVPTDWDDLTELETAWRVYDYALNSDGILIFDDKKDEA